MDELLMKKARLVRQLIEFLSEWAQVNNGAATPMKVVSSRFGKAFNKAGGFPEVIDELRRDGTIIVGLTEAGGRMVQLTNGATVTLPLQVIRGA